MGEDGGEVFGVGRVGVWGGGEEERCRGRSERKRGETGGEGGESGDEGEGGGGGGQEELRGRGGRICRGRRDGGMRGGVRMGCEVERWRGVA